MTGGFVFQDKAATLAFLDGQLASARVLPQTTISAAAWRSDRPAVVGRVLALPWAKRRPGDAQPPALIVRSSAQVEDGLDRSFAGHFTSIQGVVGPAALAAGVEAVFQSYGRGEDEDLVLVQPMLERPILSGVATSREVGSGRPYIVINTSMGADTTAVTGGRRNDTEVFYHFRGALETPGGREAAVIRMLREVEARTGQSRLDLEFAFVDREALPVLLQARPLAASPPVTAFRGRHARSLAEAEQKVRAVLSPHPLARGRRSVLGCMTDWNPAEMIGVRPRPLAMSLYRRLITDQVWARQRQAYGYRDLGGFPLLIDILGSPYIDVRASFESFLPATLPEDAASRLVDLYVDRLLAEPALHDKAEFEIVLSCYAFDIDRRLDGLRQAGASTQDADRLRAALHAMTQAMIDPGSALQCAEYSALGRLQQRHSQIIQSDLPPLSAAYWLLEDCRRFGARPFAGLARIGFVAMELLNSLVTVGAVGEADRRAFLMSVSTVTTRLQADLLELPRQAFLSRYGHLRPGAYDILSPRYDEAPDLYFGAHDHTAGDDGAAEPDRAAAARRALWARLSGPVQAMLAEHGFSLSGGQLLDFIADGVRGREEAKFLFTRNLSDALSRISLWGAGAGLSPAELSYSDIRVVEQAYGSTKNPMDLFSQAIREGRAAHEITEATCLPPIISAPGQLWSFKVPTATPTYVTALTAQGPVLAQLDPAALSGAIVLIPSADPGFDWIFAHKIAGLITAYGGANSHMAIRAAELDLPAVIGAGERLFAQWSRADRLSIDCANHRVDILPTRRAG